MKIEKIEIKQEKFDINLKFYFFLKYIVKTKLTENQLKGFLQLYGLNIKLPFDEIVDKFTKYVNEKIKKGSEKQKLIFETIGEIASEIELTLFIFSLKLFLIKDLLLNEAKTKDLLDITKLERLDPLSLEYDKITLFSPYSTRVNGSLLSLIFFDKLEKKETNFMSKDAENFIQNLSFLGLKLIKEGVEPNQIFMILFNESINQSIISDSGSNYEDRILSVLTSIGIEEKEITKTHDKDDASTEFDFFFEIEGLSYGIGAKRTLRERYKQFIKTAQTSEIDVMIEITLGVDLNEEKAKTIVGHNTHLFVSDEIYQNRKFLRDLKGVYSVKDLTLKTLKSLKES